MSLNLKTDSDGINPPRAAWSSQSSTTTTAHGKDLIQQDAEDLEAQANQQVLELARRLTDQSHGQPASLFPVPDDGALNPSSPQFNARKWAKAFYDIRTDTSEGNPPKTTGIAFKDLNVYGFGSSTDFQKSVGNIFLEAGTVFKKLLRTRQRRVDILHDLEGVVHSGEMLAVLGPPGSGCSTFLKTVAGDTRVPRQ